VSNSNAGKLTICDEMATVGAYDENRMVHVFLNINFNGTLLDLYCTI
jgi:hypothetical protein